MSKLPPPPVEPPPQPGPWPGPTHPRPTHPDPPPRPTRGHLAVNGREYLADLDALTTRAMALADDYERRVLWLADSWRTAGVR